MEKITNFSLHFVSLRSRPASAGKGSYVARFFVFFFFRFFLAGGGGGAGGGCGGGVCAEHILQTLNILRGQNSIQKDQDMIHKIQS